MARGKPNDQLLVPISNVVVWQDFDHSGAGFDHHPAFPLPKCLPDLALALSSIRIGRFVWDRRTSFRLRNQGGQGDRPPFLDRGADDPIDDRREDNACGDPSLATAQAQESSDQFLRILWRKWGLTSRHEVISDLNCKNVRLSE
jgi:hypothetical protein